MLRSLYAAVSGVKAHQTYLDVTGNNIANVNTAGFKRDTVNFRDMMYQTIQGASAPNASVPIGGTNPMQVGLGVGVGSISTVHTQGSSQFTGSRTDMAIEGDGFFVVRNGGQTFYTRAGNFALDRDGNLVQNGTGNLVQGYGYSEVVDPNTGITSLQMDNNLTNINIPLGRKTPAKATDLLGFRCNLCSTTTPGVPGLDQIPGGANKVLRPHEYTAYGEKKVDYVSDTAPGTPAANQLWFDSANNELKRWNTTKNDWDQLDVDPETAYYGIDATNNKMYATGDAAYSGYVVSGRKIVTGIGSGAPTTPPAPALGDTYLDSDAGMLYTANAFGNWGAPTAVAKEMLYSLADGSAAFIDRTGTPPMTALPLNTDPTVLDVSGGSGQLFTFDPAAGTWGNVNRKLGLFATADSTTTQATIDAFGESMIKKHDWSDKITVYDSLGNPYTAEIFFRKVVEKPADPSANPPTSAETEWDWYACYMGADGKPIETFGEGAGTMVFGDDGLLKKAYHFTPDPKTPDPNGTPNSQPEYNWTMVEKIIDPNYPGYDANKHDVLPTGVMVADFNVIGSEGSVTKDKDGNLTYGSNLITLDFLGNNMATELGQNKEPIDGVTQYGSKSTTKGYYQNGYAMGELNDFAVGGDGSIVGIYSNGQNIPLGMIALATFANPQGLTKMGDSLYAESINSGMAQVGRPGQGSAGSVRGAYLEMSNVDLSEEFVNLIRAQRGFQANTRVVTTSDQILEELINMKR